MKVYLSLFPRYRLRLETSLPADRIGDGDGLSGLRVIRSTVWLVEGDVEVDQALSTLLWQRLEAKIGPRDQLPDTVRRCRIIRYDTQEVKSKRFFPTTFTKAT